MRFLRYAAYGSNLHPARLRARVPSARLLGIGHLPNQSLCFHKKGKDGSGKCSIRKSGAGVHVAVYEIRSNDKPRLDRVEHAGIGYAVEDLEVQDFGECFTYRATEAHIVEGLAPYCWYREMVLRGFEVHGFPQPYIDVVRSVPGVSDPDSERRRKNWAFIHARFTPQ